MGYEKQYFSDGEIITASQLNHIENGIVAATGAYNLLDNSNFEVAQVGYPGQHGSDWYVADRWHAESRPNAVMYDNLFSFNANNGGSIVVYQGTTQEKANKLIGKTVTLAICTNNDEILTASGIVANDTDVAMIDGTAYNACLHFFTSANSYQLVRIMVKSGQTANIKWIALYEGSYTVDTLPAYQPKGYAVELAECQRYYYKFNPAENGIYLPAMSGITQIPGFMFPVEMRAVPTMTIKAMKVWDTTGISDISSTISSKRCTLGGLQYIEMTSAFARQGLIIMTAEFSADL